MLRNLTDKDAAAGATVAVHEATFDITSLCSAIVAQIYILYISINDSDRCPFTDRLWNLKWSNPVVSGWILVWLLCTTNKLHQLLKG
jgi:hypothetical protein